MENDFFDKVEDNAVVRIWSEETQLAKGDSLARGYTSELWDYTHISVTQNNLQELKRDMGSRIRIGKKKVDVFALSIYGLVIFPRALRHVDEAVSDLFDRLEIVATPRRDNISEENWTTILQNLQEDDVEWRAPLLILDEILYRCGSFDWALLLGIWGAVLYASLLVHRMKRLAVGSMTTPEYGEWRSKRINDNIPELDLEGVRPMEEYLQVIPSELEIIKQDFERRNLELEKKIE
ncbi:hypothetical protein Goshw_021008 [Gossypium schwendimanii]|uniref:DUF7745 domain-containing protein n=1 Tax=Gossypium schwendimanii TaxID=34291 RepID=A0A7J9N981_GOSSC|nr:hypothetical protein [Gossypium schwendimanii]